MISTRKMNESSNDKAEETGDSRGATSESSDKADLGKYVKDQQMRKVLNKKGITKLFPIQYQTFSLIYKGEDIVAKDRTGSGKTLAFALPMIIRMRQQNKFKGSHNPKFLIVLPTRELALQVRDQIVSLRYKDQEDFIVTAIYGGNGMQQQLESVSKGVDIIVATPGRLIDFLNRGAIKLGDLEAICLDEADQMLKIGFKQDIQKIFQFVTKAKTSKVQCLLFSATIPEWIWEISNQYQSKNKKFIDMIKDSTVKTSKTVEHYCLKASPMQKQAYIGSLIKHFFKGKNGKVIIFCETKREVDRIGNSGLIPLSLETLHGDIKQFQRQKVFRRFKSGQVDCLIATNVAARGLDFPEIDLIIQMQPPNTTDAYIHRSGRTGRAGKSGVCVTLYSFKEETSMKRIENQTKIILHHMNTKELKPIIGNQQSKEGNYGQQHSNYRNNNSRDENRYQRSGRDERHNSKPNYDRNNSYERKQYKPNMRKEEQEQRKIDAGDLEY